jgi:flagellar basal body P-ring formation protein FlgA
MSQRSRVIILTVILIATCLFIGTSAFSKNTDEELIKQVKRHIEQNMQYSPDSVRIEILSGVPRMDQLSGIVKYKIESKPTEEYIGDTSFMVRILANDVFIKEESVRVRIEVLREYVVSQNTITRGQVISLNDVNIQKKWVRRISLNAVSSLDEVVDRMIVVSIRPNTQITRSMIKEVMPVKKGKMVQVVLDNGVMRMLTNGLAEEDGAEDSIVKIRNISSNKIIFARVIGPSRVQVDF